MSANVLLMTEETPETEASPRVHASRTLKPVVLEVNGLTKLYPGVVALDKVDLIMREGSIHALVGENGAGKSTLIKMLAGAIRPDAGIIQLAGQPVSLRSPVNARQLGIAVVHQHTHLIPDLTV